MEKNEQLKIIEEMQIIVNQMIKDDLKENPDLQYEMFTCDCCAKSSSLAGSIEYGTYRLCNDCVLKAEIGFALKKINSIDELIVLMEDKRLEEICNFIKNDQTKQNN